jgi:acyl dehydratase
MASPFPALGDDVIGALGLSQWRYLKPLFVGDTVHVEVTIASKRETSDPKRGIIERQIRLVRHGGEVVQEGNVQTMIKRRGGGE